MQWDCGVPEVLPFLSLVWGLVALSSSTDTGLSSGFVNPGPAIARGSQTFDQSHSTIGDVASQSQGLHFLVKGYL